MKVKPKISLQYVVGQLRGAIVPESDRSALLEFNLSSPLSALTAVPVTCVSCVVPYCTCLCYFKLTLHKGV